MPSQGALKTLVIVLGLAVALSLAGVVFGIVRTATEGEGGEPHPPEDTLPIKEILLGQPAGSTLSAVSAEGRHIYLTIKGGGWPDRVVVLDRLTSVVEQTIWTTDPVAGGAAGDRTANPG